MVAIWLLHFIGIATILSSIIVIFVKLAWYTYLIYCIYNIIEYINYRMLISAVLFEFIVVDTLCAHYYNYIVVRLCSLLVTRIIVITY